MVHTKALLSLILVWGFTQLLFSQDVVVITVDKNNLPGIVNKKVSIRPPSDGLWSIATQWEDGWPSAWKHASPKKITRSGPWHIFQGTLQQPEGNWELQDAYRMENGRIKCIRRFKWNGKTSLEQVTLSVRWKIDAIDAQAFMPNILYYGNPSGEKNGKQRVPVFHGKPGEMALFEEHRFTMPFAALEWETQEGYNGAALHTRPSPVPGGHIQDQWWSLGVKVNEKDTELLLLSGPVGYNKQKNVVKGLQTKPMEYGDTYVKVAPGTVIEKTFYLEVFPVSEQGTAFQQPIHTAIDIFKPFYTDDLPTYQDIISDKYRFAKSRWVSGSGYAGFNMYPDISKEQIVMGWAGQSEAPAYALQLLAARLGEKEQLLDMVQKSLDHICTSPIGANGFPVQFDIEKKEWFRYDPVSEGQALNSIALAVSAAQNHPELKTKKWRNFLKKACMVHSKRLLDAAWAPLNTAEAFYIAPLLLAATLFDEPYFSKAALKVANYYAKRHLTMEEPYWGGTLDANCEDKEGAWGAFQGFLAAYEFTRDEKYLQYAQHAGDVVLSYTVIWDIPLPPGRMSDHGFKTRGWTGVSPQNQHLDVYGVLMTPAIYKLGAFTGNEALKRLAKVMYRSCGQIIDPFGSQGEQLQHTNFAQHGDMSDVYKLRGGYSESWTVFWITAHFLHAAAQFEEMNITL